MSEIENIQNTTRELEAANKLGEAVKNNSSEELHIENVPKSDQSPGEPTILALGNQTLAPPKQGVKVYEIELNFYEEIKGDGWEYDKEQRCYKKVLRLEAKRLPALYRGQFLEMLATGLLNYGIITHDGQYVRNVEMTDQQLLGLMASAPDIADLASLVLGLDKEIMVHANPISILEWFSDFINNEPNYIDEAANFLMLRQKKRTKKT